MSGPEAVPDRRGPAALLVVGDANPDLVLRGDVEPRWGQAEQLLDSADLVLGGSAAITACGTARLGVPTRLLAAVGADLYGRYVREVLTGRGVDTSAVRTVDEPTGLSVILSAKDRAIFTLTGAIDALTGPDVVLDGVTHVHVSSYFLQPRLASGLVDVFAAARAAGIGTSLDTNWDPAERWAGVRELLRYTDVFLPNAAEFAAVTGAATPDDAAAGLVAGGTTVVLKLGAEGARAWWPRGSYAVPALPVEPVDTVGAGDSFNAGFLAAWLHGAPLPQCLRTAVAAGSLSTRAAGGTAAQADPAELAAARATSSAPEPATERS
jgi:sugar/nucleoside kinase (ribokinase family)